VPAVVRATDEEPRTLPNSGRHFVGRTVTMRKRAILAALLTVLNACAAEPGGTPPAKDEARLLRFPTIHGGHIVFGYAGNLYEVPTAGGTARRLTSHEGYEMFPRFSPDGKWLAFTGQYDGNTEVYVMPASGGVPRRLTWTATLARDDVSDRMGPNNIVMGWKHDGKTIVFRSRMHSFNDFLGQLYTVSVEGGPPEQLPLPRGGFCSYSPNDDKIAFNRVFREFRTWKRYRGGMEDDVWSFDFGSKKTENVTKVNQPRPYVAEEAAERELRQAGSQNIIPMWHENKIYFLSDRDDLKRMNLFVTDLSDGSTRQLTQFKDFDCKFPSLGDKAIVFENGGYVYRHDLDGGQTVRVPIHIYEDLSSARGGVVNVSHNVTNFEISPDGKRALFGARGDVFTVPAKDGPTRNLTNTSGVHERNSKWSPDGRLIAFISDASGEDEVWVVPADGKGEPRQLTSDSDTYKFELSWSPDSKQVLWSDKKLRVRFVDVASKVVTTARTAKVWEVRDATWSPDSRWIAWSEQSEENGFSQVMLYNIEQKKSFEVTDTWYAANTPAFSADGKYLFFVASRDFNPVYSATEWNHAYRDMDRIYFVTLAADTPSPFKPRSDEAQEGEKKEEPKKEAPKKGIPIKVDVEGLKDRMLDLPVQPGAYRSLVSSGDGLYYIRQSSKDAKPALHVYDLAARKETALGSVGGYEISVDGKKMLVSQEGKYGIVDLPKGLVTISEPLDLSGMEIKLDRQKEWDQIFRECWRQMRDFFYDPGLHGVDWKAIKERYEPLAARAAHRYDLTYVIGEMIGELDAGHCYAGGGEAPHVQRLPMGLLGADFSRDAATGFYRIEKIYRGSPGDPHLHGPLTGVGVDAKIKDYIVAIDGKPVNKLASLNEPLVNKVGKQVTLTLNAAPKAEGGREVVVVPVGSESNLRYHDWVETNIKKVSEATRGKVGYLHVPDMQVVGLNEFVKHFYPQTHKRALIIDVRGNAGGNVSPMLIERLRREIAMISVARNGAPTQEPQAIINGPLVCLINEFSASDGDIFPYRFRQHKLGKLIGKRTWGGVVGIRNALPLLDGGTLNRPEFSRYDVEGKRWIMEGYGVDPDIVVDNDPAREYAGQDDQLDRAIAEILDELKTKEKKIPAPPPALRR
jgi:tricorn protease